LLRREWFNAGNFTKAVGALTAIFMLIVVAVRTFTGRDAAIIVTFSVITLLTLAFERIILWRRRRGALPPSEGR
jgi:hypothetical protein